jgi:hypothetical protein
MHRCTQCHGKFGLIRHRWWGSQFCSKKCQQSFLCERERASRWLYGDFLGLRPSKSLLT